MARKAIQRDQIVKLIVGAGQASPSPPVGPALGSKGVKSMDFCKEFNARTANYIAGTPVPARVTVRPDRSFTFELRTPSTASLLLSAANVERLKARQRGAGNTPGPGAFLRAAAATPAAALAEAAAKSGGALEKSTFALPELKGSAANQTAGMSNTGMVGTISLKHVYEIAKIKREEVRLSGLEMEGLCRSVVAQAGSLGVLVVP